MSTAEVLAAATATATPSVAIAEMSTASLPFPLAAPRKRSASKTQQNFHPINNTDPSELATPSANANNGNGNGNNNNNSNISDGSGVSLNGSLSTQMKKSNSGNSNGSSSGEPVTSKLSLVTDLNLDANGFLTGNHDIGVINNGSGNIIADADASVEISSQITPILTKRPAPPVSHPSVSSSSSSSSSATQPAKPILLRKPLPKDITLQTNNYPTPPPVSMSISDSSSNSKSLPSTTISTVPHIVTNGPSPLPPSQPQPQHKTRQKPTKPALNSSTSHSNSSSNSTASIPSLRKHIHVVRLISPEQPEECLKILNVPLYPDTLKIGRQNTPKTSNKITDGFFDSRVLSRNHAELFIKDTQLYIRDLKSSNGTFINDAKLEPYKDYKLSLGDKIDLGTTLESQMAHKKITCIVKDFDFLTLKEFENQVEDINNKDDLISKKMELFNSTFDAMLFGEIVDDIILDIDEVNVNDRDSHGADRDELFDLINYEEDEENEDETSRKSKSKSNRKSSRKFQFVQGLDIRPASTPQEIVKKLIVAVNNEYLQQQRLKELNTFVTNYNHAVKGSVNPSAFRLYDKLLRKGALDTSRDNLIKTGTKSVEGEKEKERLKENEKEKVLTKKREMERQAKYARMEEQLKNSLNELDVVRGHLSTAKTRELQASQLQDENATLKDLVEKYRREIGTLQLEKKQLEEEKQLQMEKEKEKEKVKEREALAAAAAATATSDGNWKKSAPLDSLLCELSAHAVRYGGLVALAAAVLYVAGPGVRAYIPI